MSLFFFNDTATTEIYTLSLHDALPIYLRTHVRNRTTVPPAIHVFHTETVARANANAGGAVLRTQCSERSEEHTSELQSQSNLVCRLLLEKKQVMHRTRLLSGSQEPVSR